MSTLTSTLFDSPIFSFAVHRYAAEEGRVHTMKELLASGASADVASEQGHTALHLAAKAQQTKVGGGGGCGGTMQHRHHHLLAPPPASPLLAAPPPPPTSSHHHHHHQQHQHHHYHYHNRSQQHSRLEDDGSSPGRAQVLRPHPSHFACALLARNASLVVGGASAQACLVLLGAGAPVDHRARDGRTALALAKSNVQAQAR